MRNNIEIIKGEQHNPEREADNVERFPEDLFENHDVVVLGETFHGKHSETILNFLNTFGPQINHVFIEMPADYQDSVDKYIASGEVDEKLEDFFAGAAKEGKSVKDLLKIFSKAKEIKKEITCFDSSKIQEGEYQKISKRKNEKYFLRGESRDEDMFVSFQRRYEQFPGKYLLIVGANHSKEGKYPDGDKRLGERLKEVFGERYTNFEMEHTKEQISKVLPKEKMGTFVLETPFWGGVIREHFKKSMIPPLFKLNRTEQIDELEYFAPNGAIFRISTILPEGVTLTKVENITVPYFNPITKKVVYGEIMSTEIDKHGGIKDTKLVPFFKNPAAFIALLHEVGHAVHKQSFKEVVVKILQKTRREMRREKHKPTDKTDENVDSDIIQQERDAWAYTLKKIRKLRKRGIDLAPQLDTEEKLLAEIHTRLFSYEIDSIHNEQSARIPLEMEHLGKQLSRIAVRPKRIKHS